MPSKRAPWPSRPRKSRGTLRRGRPSPRPNSAKWRCNARRSRSWCRACRARVTRTCWLISNLHCGSPSSRRNRRAASSHCSRHCAWQTSGSSVRASRACRVYAPPSRATWTASRPPRRLTCPASWRGSMRWRAWSMSCRRRMRCRRPVPPLRLRRLASRHRHPSACSGGSSWWTIYATRREACCA